MTRRCAPVLFALALMGAASAASAQSPAALNETPDQNVKASKNYQALVCTNPGFRKSRIDKECGPLQGSSLYDGCVASFDCEKTPSGANWRNAPPSETVK